MGMKYHLKIVQIQTSLSDQMHCHPANNVFKFITDIKSFLRYQCQLFFFSIIVDKIDADNDGFITLVELKDWIRYTQKRYIDEDVERHWSQHNPNKDDLVSWEVTKNNYLKYGIGFRYRPLWVTVG